MKLNAYMADSCSVYVLFNYIQANYELKTIFESLVDNAESFYKLTNRYLQIWGELGDLFSEIEYGIKRYRPHTQGSDGKLGYDFIEIKLSLLKKIKNK